MEMQTVVVLVTAYKEQYKQVFPASRNVFNNIYLKTT
jgi:hypothetical protein